MDKPGAVGTTESSFWISSTDWNTTPVMAWSEGAAAATTDARLVSPLGDLKGTKDAEKEG
ncbi:hypothetical protein C4D60_Mb05t31100 [Musa balbisiana]|uniref:Uncharacterized protein n=1 Tax=Musa balbisiana TaxID=52838 RepID=A0A4V4H8J4_MUSBA|nr:hypothetical protein C4D60_Mb05t31100 [Musa balbisiana]